LHSNAQREGSIAEYSFDSHVVRPPLDRGGPSALLWSSTSIAWRLSALSYNYVLGLQLQ